MVVEVSRKRACCSDASSARHPLPTRPTAAAALSPQTTRVLPRHTEPIRHPAYEGYTQGQNPDYQDVKQNCDRKNANVNVVSHCRYDRLYPILIQSKWGTAMACPHHQLRPHGSMYQHNINTSVALPPMESRRFIFGHNAIIP